MEYKKYDIGPYNLHIINTDKFKTVTVRVSFKRPCLKEELTKRTLLGFLLTESCKKYDTKRKLDIKTEDLYDLKYSGFGTISGNYNIISFEESFLNEKYTEKGMFEKSLNFLFDLIFNPNIEKNKFTKEQFDLCKKIIQEDLETIKERPSYYSTLRMYEEMDKSKPVSYHSTGYLEDLKKITVKNIYDYYLSVLNNDIVDIFIIGDVDPLKCRKLVAKSFNINTIKQEGISHIVEYDKFRSKPKIVKEKLDIEQSRLVIGLKLKNLTEFERKYVMGMYSYILGGGPDSKLFKEVREKHSLCYGIGSSYSGIFSVLKISAGINSENFDKTVKLIKKQIKDISLGKFDERDIKCAYMTYMSTFKEIMDSPASILSTYSSMHYLKLDPIEKRKEEIAKITKEMIIDVSKKVYLDTIYLLEGSND